MTQSNQTEPLSLGAEVVQRLLPHRRPFLMVDRIAGYARSPVPAMRASRFISVNEEIFAGHFPGLPLWPGVYTIEGMGQTCNLLEVLLWMQETHAVGGHDADEVLVTLRALDALTSLRPHPPIEGLDRLTQGLAQPLQRMGMSAAVDVKLLAPVLAGQRLDYLVRRTLVMGNMRRFEVEAEVAGKLVAKGVMDSLVGVGASAAV